MKRAVVGFLLVAATVLITTPAALTQGGWTVLFDGSAIATLVVAVNLVADGIQSALDE